MRKVSTILFLATIGMLASAAAVSSRSEGSLGLDSDKALKPETQICGTQKFAIENVGDNGTWSNGDCVGNPRDC